MIIDATQTMSPKQRGITSLCEDCMQKYNEKLGIIPEKLVSLQDENDTI